MSNTKPLPCPQKKTCPLPPSRSCTADQFKTCGMANGIECITALLRKPHYARRPASEKVSYIRSHFGVNVAESEVSYEASRLATIIKARIDIVNNSS